MEVISENPDNLRKYKFKNVGHFQSLLFLNHYQSFSKILSSKCSYRGG